MASLRKRMPESLLLRKVAREVEWGGLEIRYTVLLYRGFESLTFRRITTLTHRKPGGFFFFTIWKAYVNPMNLFLSEGQKLHRNSSPYNIFQ